MNEEHVKILHDLCFVTNSFETKHKNFLKALKLLKYISKHIDPKQVDENCLSLLIWSTIACTHYFYSSKHLKRTNSCRQDRNYTKSLKLHKKCLHIFINNQSEFVFNTTLTYITEFKLWKYEHFCQILLKNVLFDKTDQYINYLLTFIEYQIHKNIYVAEIILRILFHLLEHLDNKVITSNLLYVFLEMFKNSLIQHNQSYDNLRIGFEVNIIVNILISDLNIYLRLQSNFF